MKYVLVIILFELLFSQDIPFFDSIRAMNLLETQCAFGPRFPGSPGSQKMKIFMKKFLTPLSDSLYIMEENISHPYQKTSLNLIIRIAFSSLTMIFTNYDI